MKRNRPHSLLKHFAVDSGLLLCFVLAVVPLCASVLSLRTAGSADAMTSAVRQGLAAFWQQMQEACAQLETPVDPVEPIGEALPDDSGDSAPVQAIRQTLGEVIRAQNLTDLLLLLPDTGEMITQYRTYQSAGALLADYALDGMDLAAVCASLCIDPRAGFLPVRRLRGVGTLPTYTAFCYAQPLRVPLSPGGAQTPAVALLFFDKQAFLSAVFPRRALDGPWLTVSWAGTELTYHRGPWIRGERLMLSASDTASGLRADIQMPPGYFDALLRRVGRLAVWTLCGTLLLCPLLAAAVGLCRIRRLRDALPDDVRACGVGTRLRLAARQYEEMAERMQGYRDRLRTISIERLLRSEALSDQECEKLRANIGPFPDRFLVAYGAIGDAAPAGMGDGHQMQIVLALDRLGSLLPKGSIMQMLGTRHFAAIIPTEPDAERTIRGVRATLSQLNRGQPVRLRMRFSATLTQMRQVHDALEYARLRLVTDEGHGPRHADQQARAGYSNALERLHHSAGSGNHDKALAALESFLTGAGALGISLEQQYYAAKTALELARADSQGDISALDGLHQYGIHTAPDAVLDALRSATARLAESIEKRRLSHETGRRNALIRHAQTRYTDPGFYAGGMAQAFHLSDKYIYSAFKEKTGMSPASYILKLRLEHAARLLAETQLSVQQIAEDSGFATISAYNKAFKRYYGMTSSQYRERAAHMDAGAREKALIVLEDGMERP